MSRDLKARLRDAMREIDDDKMGDGKFWALVHERCGLEYGAAFDIICGDPTYFGYAERAKGGER